MKELILNEKSMVEQWINDINKPEDISIAQLISYYTKYYYGENLSIDEIKDKVLKKLTSYQLSAAEYQEYEVVTKIESYYMALCNHKMNLLRDINGVAIYQSDLDQVDKCTSLKQKKFLFTMFVLARFTDRYGWVYLKHNDIYKLANVSTDSDGKNNIIYELYKVKLIKMPKKIDNLKIGVNLDEPKDEPVIIINELKNIGVQYVVFTNNKKYKQCEECGKLIKIKSKNDGSTKYCKQCAYKIKLQQTNDCKQRQKQDLEEKVHTQFSL